MQQEWTLLLPDSAVHAPAAVLGKHTAGAMSDGLSQNVLWHVHGAVSGHLHDDQAENRPSMLPAPGLPGSQPGQVQLEDHFPGALH